MANAWRGQTAGRIPTPGAAKTYRWAGAARLSTVKISAAAPRQQNQLPALGCVPLAGQCPGPLLTRFDQVCFPGRANPHEAPTILRALARRSLQEGSNRLILKRESRRSDGRPVRQSIWLDLVHCSCNRNRQHRVFGLALNADGTSALPAIRSALILKLSLTRLSANRCDQPRRRWPNQSLLLFFLWQP